MPTLNDIIAPLEQAAPRAWQESWDNAGWQVCPSDPATTECSGAIVTLDMTEAAVEEAARAGFNLVISHHPLLFKGLKRIVGASTQERIAAAAIRAGSRVLRPTASASPRRSVKNIRPRLRRMEAADRARPPHSIFRVQRPSQMEASLFVGRPHGISCTRNPRSAAYPVGGARRFLGERHLLFMKQT